MSTRTIVIRTDADGEFTYERAFTGSINAIEYKNDADEGLALSTPDIDVSDGVYELSILSVDAVASDTVYQPRMFAQDTDGTDLAVGTSIKAAVPFAVMGTLKVVVTGGGANNQGRLRILYDA